MEIISSFKEFDIIKILDKQTIYLIKEGNISLDNSKHTYYKIYLTVDDIKKLYNYVEGKGLC